MLLNPSQLDMPAFAMNVPLGYNAGVANNVWMDDLTGDDRVVDFDRAMSQWNDLYQYMASQSVVYLVPTPPAPLQDLVFIANMGIVLGKHDVVVSRFKAPARDGESEVGHKFFQQMGYHTHEPPATWEGEADLKHLHGNIYIGGYGQRSELAVYEWMTDQFDVDIVPVRMRNEKLYHLDCSIFPITREATLVCTELFDSDEVAAIESKTEIVDIPLDIALSGITNSVRLGNTLLNASHLYECEVGDDEWYDELDKNRMLEDIASDFGFEVTYVNLSEYLKSGALLSCMVMHLNRHSYTIDLA